MVLSVVSVHVTPRVAKTGGILFVAIDCLLFVVFVVRFDITHQQQHSYCIVYTKLKTRVFKGLRNNYYNFILQLLFYWFWNILSPFPVFYVHNGIVILFMEVIH